MMQGRRGMMDDLFDFLFTVTMAAFLLYFVGFVLNQSAAGGAHASLDTVADAKRLDSGINNLRVQLYNGENLEQINVSTFVARSKVLGGRVVTVCGDYLTKTDCEKDVVALYEADDSTSCVWKESSKSCYTFHASRGGG